MRQVQAHGFQCSLLKVVLVVAQHQQPTNKKSTPRISRPNCCSRKRTPRSHSYSTTDLQPRPILLKNTVREAQASPQKNTTATLRPPSKAKQFFSKTRKYKQYHSSVHFLNCFSLWLNTNKPTNKTRTAPTQRHALLKNCKVQADAFQSSLLKLFLVVAQHQQPPHKITTSPNTKATLFF
jgi:hypothetical protein